MGAGITSKILNIIQPKPQPICFYQHRKRGEGMNDIDYIRHLTITGYCWRCGIPCKELFCCDKHKRQFEMAQERQIKKGKKAGLGRIVRE